MKAILIVSILFLFLASSVNSQSADQIQLESLIAEMISNNPQLNAERYSTKSAKTQIDQNSAWEAPQVGVELFQTPIQSFPNPLKHSMETDYFIQQMFPFPGKINAMVSSAKNNAGMVEQQYFTTLNGLIKQLKDAYYELYLVQKKIEINEENKDLMRQFVEVSRKQYEVGMGKQPDVIRAQTELSLLITEGINLEKEETDINTMLNALLSRKADSKLGIVPELNDDLPDWGFNEMFTLAVENRPELKSMTFNIEMNKSEFKASKLEYYPDLMARIMYKNMTDTKNDFWSVMLGVNVPVAFWSKDKFSGKIEENELKVNSAQEQYSYMKNMVSSSVQNALVKIATNKNLINLYKSTVIPQADQTLQSTISAYRTGNTEFLMVIDAYKMYLMSRLDYYMSKMNYHQSLAQLEQAVGLSIEKIKENFK